MMALPISLVFTFRVPGAPLKMSPVRRSASMTFFDGGFDLEGFFFKTEKNATKKMPGMNGTHLSSGSVALAVGDFLELAARFGEQLVGLGASFFSPGLLPSRS